jgi:hypothetical protein
MNTTQFAIAYKEQGCAYRSGSNLVMMLGELYFCCRVIRRVELGIIEKNEKSYVDMYGDCSRNEKRTNIRNILNAKYTPACAYCVGKRSDAKHHLPAVQLTIDEMNNNI